MSTVVEVRGSPVAHAHLRRQRLEALVPMGLVAARVSLEVLDPRDLEPDEEGSVVRDPLRVRLREPHPDVRREREAVHGRNPRIAACPPQS